MLKKGLFWRSDKGRRAEWVEQNNNLSKALENQKDLDTSNWLLNSGVQETQSFKLRVYVGTNAVGMKPFTTIYVEVEIK